ncbi:MAG TPA: GNAT family N-acetyltransferase, partial [Clostridia bacterium]|nr:GNAT family N-acetyltransferase [Clostridia bacterium]
MRFETNKLYEDKHTQSFSINVLDGDRCVSTARIGYVDSVFAGKYIKAMTVGGVATEPEYRRKGFVRKMFQMAFNDAISKGACASFLHPFSFSYYRKFGYEKVADQLIVEFPMNKLSHIPRESNLHLLKGSDRLEDVISIYNEFALKRNIMFYRHNGRHFFTNPDRFKGSTYIWYDKDGKPSSYISLSVENYYHVNHMRSINLNVYEMAFTSKESLLKLFGFMRMFEGENDTVKIHNYAMSPEIDLILRHYIHTTYKRYPDLMARILDVKTILESNTYPQGKGHFRVNITDDLEYTKGVWEVEFENGVGVAKRVDKDKYDVSLSMPAFTQIVYGYDKYNADVLAYMDGVEIFNEKSDFFHVFPKRYNGLFEHF